MHFFQLNKLLAKIKPITIPKNFHEYAVITLNTPPVLTNSTTTPIIKTKTKLMATLYKLALTDRTIKIIATHPSAIDVTEHSVK